MPLLSSNETEELKRLNKDHDGVIGLLIKWRYPFYTDIQSLTVPPNSALVGVFGSPLRRHMDAAAVSKFALVVYYDTNYEKALEASIRSVAFQGGGAHTDTISLPEIAEVIKEIAAIVDCKKLRLIIWEEMLVYFGASLRESLGISGPTNAELKKIRDKRAMKEYALEKGIPTAPFLVLSDLSNAEEARTKIELSLSYPIFVKPIYGVASAGNARLNSREELEAWLLATNSKDEKNVYDNGKHEYLFENSICNGMEFWAQVSVAKNRRPKITVVDYMPHLGLFESLKVAGKVAICSALPDSANRIMPGILDFVQLVTDSYAPPPPTHFTVQGFHLNQGGFLLTEMGYRIPGARSTGRSYYTIGLSHEAAHLMTVLDEEGKYILKPDERVDGLHFADIWFATIPGILQSKRIPQLDQIKSTIKVEWYVDVGRQMQRARSLTDMVVSVKIFNFNEEQCLADLKLLVNNAHLDVV